MCIGLTCIQPFIFWLLNIYIVCCCFCCSFSFNWIRLFCVESKDETKWINKSKFGFGKSCLQNFRSQFWFYKIILNKLNWLNFSWFLFLQTWSRNSCNRFKFWLVSKIHIFVITVCQKLNSTHKMSNMLKPGINVLNWVEKSWVH